MNKKDQKLKEDEWNSYDFDNALSKFVYDEPFYSHLSCQIQKEKTEHIPTAGVTVKDGKMYLYYNEKYFDELHWMHRHGLLMHEFLHLGFNHTTSRLKKQGLKVDKKWFWAADFSINSLIDERFLPPHGLVPGKWHNVDPNLKNHMTEQQWNDYMSFVSMVKSWPKGESADWYYQQMSKDDNLENGFEIARKLSGDGIMDDHDIWGEMSEEDQEIMQEEINSVLKKALEDCKDKGRWGSVSMEHIRILQDLISKQITWQELLKMFIGNNVSSHKSSTIKKINKRYPYIHPGTKKGRSARIAICIDQSGSMSQKALEMLSAELSELSELTDFVVVPFDSHVIEDKIYTWKRGEKLNPKRVACGGTSFHAPTQWVNENHQEFDAVFFMTDGMCAQPQACIIPRAWIIIPNGKLLFKTDEMTIEMK